MERVPKLVGVARQFVLNSCFNQCTVLTGPWSAGVPGSARHAMWNSCSIQPVPVQLLPADLHFVGDLLYFTSGSVRLSVRVSLCSNTNADYTADYSSCDLIIVFNCRKIWGYRVILVELIINTLMSYSLPARSWFHYLLQNKSWFYRQFPMRFFLSCFNSFTHYYSGLLIVLFRI